MDNMKKLKMALLPIMLVASNATADINFDKDFSVEPQAAISQQIDKENTEKIESTGKRFMLKEAMEGANNGDVSSQYALGLIYYTGGYGVTQDKEQSFDWHEKSAKNGHWDSQYFVSLMYLEGDGVEKNAEMSAYWSKKSAEQGHSDAQFIYGYLNVVGDGVEQNYTEAAHWFEKSARQGNSKAQENMGRMYENGYGVEKNDKMAIAWYIEAAKQGSTSALERLEKLTNYNDADYSDSSKTSEVTTIKTSNNKSDKLSESNKYNSNIINTPDHPFWDTDKGQAILSTPGALETFTRLLKKQELAGVSNDDPFWNTNKGKTLLSSPVKLEKYYDSKIKDNKQQLER